MKVWKQIQIIGLAVWFFTITAGITVYKHYCEHDGYSINVFVETNQNCDHTGEVKTCNHDSCCLTDSNDDNFEEDCCDSEVDIYKISSDLIIHSPSFELIAIPTPNFQITYNQPIESNEKILPISNSPPQFITTSERLASLQSYLI